MLFLLRNMDTVQQSINYCECWGNVVDLPFKNLNFLIKLVRSVYIKIINYSGSILTNLNNTMQTTHHAMKKPHSYSNRKKINKKKLT